MKKILVSFILIMIFLLGIFTLSAAAERLTSLPITMLTKGYYSGETYFTLTSCEIEAYDNNESELYTTSLSIWLDGFFDQGSQMDLAFYCYDASGNYLGVKHGTVYASTLTSEYAYFSLVVPDVTASIEIAAKNPHAWSNTYYYCKYRNVYADDGRIQGIPDLLLPVYEKVGWHGDVWMYSLDGREIQVPYNQVAAQQSVGWYLWEDFVYQRFCQDYDKYLSTGNYSKAFSELDGAIASLDGTCYASGLYERKTALMDAWRKRINGPLAITGSYADGGDVTIWFRNVSYKPIKAFKLQFDCYDVFNSKLSSYYSYYYVSDADLPSGESKSYDWDNLLHYQTDHIANARITQVVYSDGTSWYR